MAKQLGYSLRTNIMKFALKMGLSIAVKRLREPSTYAGVAGLFAAAHLVLPGYAPQIVEIAGMAIGSIGAVILGESPKA
jgi:hypothetical protein